jgi:ABC-type nickel/cobalt efflux system permease component RcnA
VLAAAAAGNPGYGLVLIAAFSLGMAAVMTGIGVALVYARRLLDRAPSIRRGATLAAYLPVATAVLVVVVGLYLTGQALTQVRL